MDALLFRKGEQQQSRSSKPLRRPKRETADSTALRNYFFIRRLQGISKNSMILFWCSGRQVEKKPAKAWIFEGGNMEIYIYIYM